MTVIKFQSVSKRYRLGYKVINLRDAIPKIFKSREDKWFWALKDVSFEIKKGEALGIIGPNGAGKTTILKILSKITEPTEGNAVVNGRVASLIELGAGFHPDLTGRENIYLNGAIMGMSRKEIDSKFKDIVKFSGLEEFIDTPVKRYSSGMYVRLGFAVAIHTEPDILLIDEVLAVGDMSFQFKCIKKITEFRNTGGTIIFVSHDLHNIRTVCSKALLLAKGKIQAIGNPVDVTIKYKNIAKDIQMGDRSKKSERTGNFKVEISKTEMIGSSHKKKQTFKSGETLILKIYYVSHIEAKSPVFGVGITRDDGLVCWGTTSKLAGYSIPSIKGEGSIEIVFPNLNLAPGRYRISAAIWQSDGLIPYDYQLEAASLTIKSKKSDYGVVMLDHEWRLKK